MPRRFYSDFRTRLAYLIVHNLGGKLVWYNNIMLWAGGRGGIWYHLDVKRHKIKHWLILINCVHDSSWYLTILVDWALKTLLFLYIICIAFRLASMTSKGLKCTEHRQTPNVAFHIVFLWWRKHAPLVPNIWWRKHTTGSEGWSCPVEESNTRFLFWFPSKKKKKKKSIVKGLNFAADELPTCRVQASL